MLDNLHGKAAFVSGAASGIGLAIATALVRAGARVVLADIDRARLDTAVAATGRIGEAHGVGLDVRTEDSWAAAAQRTRDMVGDVHLFVCNAGIGAGIGLIEERSVEDFDTVWGVNARGMFLGVRAFLPGMKAHGQPGHVVITASVMGLFCRPHAGIYSMSKYAALALGETLYLELRGTPIGASVLCPGAVDTALVTNVGQILPSRRDRPGNATDVNFLASGMATDRVADHVLDAVRTGDLYIVTHPEYRAIVEDRADVLDAAFDRGADPSHADDLSGFASYTGGLLAQVRQ